MIPRSSLRLLAIRARPQPSTWTCANCRRAYSEAAETTPAPLLLKLRNDLKVAMRAKDKARLDVLKGVLAEVTNASKTNSPIQTDMQLLSLLRKKSTASKAASEQFKQAGRQDLVQKEADQAAILEEYASGVDVMSAEDVLQAVKDTVQSFRESTPAVKAGDIMKALFAPGGKLDGKPLDRGSVPVLVKRILSGE